MSSQNEVIAELTYRIRQLEQKISDLESVVSPKIIISEIPPKKPGRNTIWIAPTDDYGSIVRLYRNNEWV